LLIYFIKSGIIY